jgi:hypothetical protein
MFGGRHEGALPGAGDRARRSESALIPGSIGIVGADVEVGEAMEIKPMRGLFAALGLLFLCLVGAPVVAQRLSPVPQNASVASRQTQRILYAWQDQIRVQESEADSVGTANDVSEAASVQRTTASLWWLALAMVLGGFALVWMRWERRCTEAFLRGVSRGWWGVLLLIALWGGSAPARAQTLIVDDSFTGRGSYPTATNGANGTNVGSPDTVGTGAWIDEAGASYEVYSSGLLYATPSNYLADPLLRPSGEQAVNQVIVIDGTTANPATGAYCWAWLRFNSTNTGYAIGASAGDCNLEKFVNGVRTTLVSGTYSQPASHNIRIVAEVSGTSPTTLSCSIYDMTSPGGGQPTDPTLPGLAGALKTETTTDSTSALQSIGGFGITVYSAFRISRIRTYEIIATAFTMSGPSGGGVGIPSTFTVTPNAALAVSESVALSDGGAGGTFSPTSLSFAANTASAQTFTYTAVSGEAGTTPTITATPTPTLGSAPTTSYTVPADQSEYEFDGYNTTIGQGRIALYPYTSGGTDLPNLWTVPQPAGGYPYNNNVTCTPIGGGAAINVGTGVNVIITGVRVMGDLNMNSGGTVGFNDRLQIYGSNNGTSWTALSTPFTQSGSGPYPHYRPRFFTEIPISTTTPYQYFAASDNGISTYWPNAGNFGNLTALRFVGKLNVGAPVQRPMQPTFSPGGVRSQTPIGVTLSCRSHGATILYTTDGSAPSFNSSTGAPTGTTQTYSSPFTITQAMCTAYTSCTVNAISVQDISGTWTQSLDTSTCAYFVNPKRFMTHDSALWYDDGYEPMFGTTQQPAAIEAHAGGFFVDPASSPTTYYLYGQSMNYGANIENYLGIWCYSSTDMQSWHNHGNILPPIPSGWNPGGAQILSEFVRPHVIYVAGNSSSQKYVAWVRLIGGSASPNTYAGVMTSPSPVGPWTWQSYTNNSGDGIGDLNLYTDPNGTFWLIYAGQTPSNNSTMKAVKLTSSGLAIDTSGAAVTVQIDGGREGMVVFDNGAYLFLVNTTSNYYDSSNAMAMHYKSTALNASNMAATWTALGATTGLTPTVGATDQRLIDHLGVIHGSTQYPDDPYNIQTTSVVYRNGIPVMIADWWLPDTGSNSYFNSNIAWFQLNFGSTGSLAIDYQGSADFLSYITTFRRIGSRPGAAVAGRTIH